MADSCPLACISKLLEEQFALLLNLLSEREHLPQLLAGVRSVVDSFEVDPNLWRVRLLPPIDCSLEFFFKSGREFAGWRSPAAPKDAQEEIAGIDILVDLGLWSAVCGKAILPTKKFNNPTVITECGIDPVYYCLRHLPFVFKIGRRSEEDADDVYC